jgi:hypothetical protein
MTLKIALTKISDDQHRFRYERADGTGATHVLATRSFLFHDLLHFAVESEAKLAKSFYGGLAAGGDHDAGEESARPPLAGEALATERIIGVLTGTFKGHANDAAALEAAARLFAAHDETPPPWFTTSFVARVRERMRVLLGRWKAVPYGRAMELTFALASSEDPRSGGKPLDASR